MQITRDIIPPSGVIDILSIFCEVNHGIKKESIFGNIAKFVRYTIEMICLCLPFDLLVADIIIQNSCKSSCDKRWQRKVFTFYSSAMSLSTVAKVVHFKLKTLSV